MVSRRSVRLSLSCSLKLTYNSDELLGDDVVGRRRRRGCETQKKK